METNIFYNGITFIASLFVFILVLSYFYKALIDYLSYKKRQSYVDKHINYIVVLEHYMEKSFDIIYKDRILIYSIEGTKPSDEEMKKHSVDFCKLTLNLLGSMLVEEFIFLYGNEETLYMVMAEYFNTKTETDEIKQESINQIMQGSDNEAIWDVFSGG